MTYRSAIRSVLSFVAALLFSAAADAQLFRAYLASDGSDANPCTLALPCRLLPAALTAVASGGEIWMLDSANYNTATVAIGKSVSILAVPGAVGSVVAVGGPAISITTSSLKVALRNLAIVPLPGAGGNIGVYMTAASALTIEHGLIADLPTVGVHVQGAGTVKIAETIIRNNGVAVQIVEGATGTISRTQILGNGDGVLASTGSATTTKVIVADSVISGGGEGVFALSLVTGAVTKIFVTRSTIEGTDFGLDSETVGAGAASLVTVSYSMVTNNINGWYQSGAGSVVKSLGNNHFTDNTATSGTLITAALQ